MNFVARANFSSLSKLKLISSSLTRSLNSTNSRHCEDRQHNEEPQAELEPIDPAIDRTKIIPVETSIRYLKSTAYQTTYGEQPVWIQYRRNYKGLFPPSKT